MRMTTKHTGTKKIATTVPVRVPPRMPVPIDTRLFAPAPVDAASGATPAAHRRAGRQRADGRNAACASAGACCADRWARSRC